MEIKKDDGTGFGEEKLKVDKVGHFGLLAIKERSKIFGGKLLSRQSQLRELKLRCQCL